MTTLTILLLGILLLAAVRQWLLAAARLRSEQGFSRALEAGWVQDDRHHRITRERLLAAYNDLHRELIERRIIVAAEGIEFLYDSQRATECQTG